MAPTLRCTGSKHGCTFATKKERALHKHLNGCEISKTALRSALALNATAEESRQRKRQKVDEEAEGLGTNAAMAEPTTSPGGPSTSESFGDLSTADNTPDLTEPPNDIEMAPPPTPIPEPEPEQPPALGRGRRARRLPRHFDDHIMPLQSSIPSLPKPPTPPPSPIASSPPPASPSPPPLPKPVKIQTEPNEFGLYRIYTDYPSRDPEQDVSLDSVLDAPTLARAPREAPDPTRIFGEPSSAVDDGNTTASETPTPFFAPFLNVSVFRLMYWFYASAAKSLSDLQRLVDNVILAPDFDQEHFRNFNATAEARRINEPAKSTSKTGTTTKPTAASAVFEKCDDWKESTVKIRCPLDHRTFPSEIEAPEFEVKGVFHRDPVRWLVSSFQDPTSLSYHLKGFVQMWKPSPEEPAQRISGEAYTSEVFLEMEAEVRAHAQAAGYTEEIVTTPIMVYSDSAHLAEFGTASLWSVYGAIGLLSKYIRAMPTSFSNHHLAYIPDLPDTIQDFYKEKFGTEASEAVLTHLKRELMQAIWLLLLTPEFMDAYENGIVILCADGVHRRIFPRLFTYSADYPEKILLASIKNLGKCPCPRCLMEKSTICDLGLKRDEKAREQKKRVDSKRRQAKVELARKKLFEEGNIATGSAMDTALGEGSMVPTRNAFSTRLFPLGFNYYQLFVPDLMHECELGVVKAVFAHLVRICHSQGKESVGELNRRFRQVPTFGRDTIRRFTDDVSGMKKLAARDFEDILQCAAPCFDGLFEEPLNGVVQDLLFTLALWHGYAKLRLHTESTLKSLRTTTRSLGKVLRRFTNITKSLEIKETPQERARRQRRQTSASGLKKGSSSSAIKIFNMFTYKLHALGDYYFTIPRFGTSDSYSTQTGELEHRRVKRFYARTNKNGYVSQITRHERRSRLLRAIKYKEGPAVTSSAPPAKSSTSKASKKKQPKHSSPIMLDYNKSDPLPFTDPLLHYHMSNTSSVYQDMTRLMGDNEDDPAVENFIDNLRDHLLGRLLGEEYTGDEVEYSFADRNTITFANNRVYFHKAMRFNFTTYDLRRDQDSINPRTRSDVMVLGHEDEDGAHPYWYARVIAICHVMVKWSKSNSPVAQRMPFLWVRWYGRDTGNKSGFAAKRLHRIGFDGKFGFLDPDEVIRAVHLIPDFKFGQTDDLLLPSSIAHRPSDDGKDWNWFKINIFVDRDMLMRFRGGAVGHLATNAATASFLADATANDKKEPTEDDPSSVERPEDINNDNDQPPEDAEANTSGEETALDLQDDHDDHDTEDNEGDMREIDTPDAEGFATL